MIRTVKIFENTQVGVQDIPDPQTGQPGGKTLFFIDSDTNTTYQLPMPNDIAKKIGQQLMGIGGIAVAGADAMAALRANGGKSK